MGVEDFYVHGGGEQVKFFKVVSKNRYKLEAKLKKLQLNKIESLNIISNKKKPIYLKYVIFDNYFNKVSKFEIYQENAYGDIVEFTSILESLDKYFYDTLKPIQVMYDSMITHSKLLDKISYLERENLDNKLISLEDLPYYSKNTTLRIPPSIKKKIVFTYNYYKRQLDENINKIDDNKQMDEAKEKNRLIHLRLNLCKKISKIHNIKLEEKGKSEYSGFFLLKKILNK